LFLVGSAGFASPCGKTTRRRSSNLLSIFGRVGFENYLLMLANVLWDWLALSLRP
jgi:hypothetical protein